MSSRRVNPRRAPRLLAHDVLVDFTFQVLKNVLVEKHIRFKDYTAPVLRLAPVLEGPGEDPIGR